MSEESHRRIRLGGAFLRRLEGLGLATRRAVANGQIANRPGSVRGGRVEFLDHRAYVAGDDLRDLDWNLFARSDEPFVKVFGAEREKQVTLVLDLSPSMTCDPAKELFACQLAAALAHVALAAGDTLRILPASDAPAPHGSGGLSAATGGEGDGSAVRDATKGAAPLPPRKGMRASREVRTYLERLPAGGPVDWTRFAESFLATPRPPGAVLVISDLWAEAVVRPLSALVPRRQDVTLLHVLTPAELSPPLGGNVRLHDAETDAEVSLALSQRDLDAYRAAVERHLEGLADGARRHGMRHLLCRTEIPFEQTVLFYLRRGGLLLR